MEQLKYNTKNRKGNHLNYEERIKIEALYKAGKSKKEIAEQLGRSERTIRREINRGIVELLNSDYTTRKEYSAEAAQKDYDEKATAKGPNLKIGNDYALVEYIEDCILNKKYSPYAIVESIKIRGLKFKTSICFKTIYNYIDQGLFINISNKDLLIKRKSKKRKYNHIRKATNNTKGRSISERPKEVDTREEYGHWEMDTVVGKQGTKTVLLVLTERKTRKEIIYKMASKSEKCVVKTLDKIERKIGSKQFREQFKTITCDNGCENLDFNGIEKSALTKTKRTTVYYAHPYSSWERGSNENANKIIRRFIPKGIDMKDITDKEIKQIEHWINNYPRKILNGMTAEMMLKSCGIKSIV